MSRGDMWASPVVVRCSVVGCSEQMPGTSLVAVSAGALIVSHDIAPGWTTGSAFIQSGECYTVVLCPEHGTVSNELGRRTH